MAKMILSFEDNETFQYEGSDYYIAKLAEKITKNKLTRNRTQITRSEEEKYLMSRLSSLKKIIVEY